MSLEGESEAEVCPCFAPAFVLDPHRAYPVGSHSGLFHRGRQALFPDTAQWHATVLRPALLLPYPRLAIFVCQASVVTRRTAAKYACFTDVADGVKLPISLVRS